MGLLQTGAAAPKPTGNAAPEAAAEGAPPAGEQYVEDGESNVSPEEQAEYEQFVDKAQELVYIEGEEGGEVRPEVIEALQAAQTQEPVEGVNPAIMALAQTAVSIVQKIDDAAREAGSPVSDDVLLHGTVAVIEDLAEVAETAGFHEYAEDDLNGALMQAIDIYRPKLIADGRTSEETLKAQFSEINEAESAGKLGDLLPGLGQPQTVGEPPVQPEA